MWETICDAQPGFCTHSSNSKFLSKFSRSPFLEFQTRKPPPNWKTSDLRWPKFTLEYPPQTEKLQIWDDQSLLQNTPPPNWKTSDLRWPKFTPEYPPKLKNFRFEMTKVYSGIPPQLKKFRFEMTKVCSGIPPPPIGLQSGRSYVETNLYAPWIPLVTDGNDLRRSRLILITSAS